MSRHIEATFEIGSWDETPFEDGDEDAKLTEALVAKRYDGDIKGTSTTKWLMAYAPDKSALYVGIEHITGTDRRQDGRPGAAARRRRSGTASPAPSLRIASGTGELSNAAGTGKFRADPAGSITLDLDGVW